MKQYRAPCENKKTGRTRGNMKPDQLAQLMTNWKPKQEKRHHDTAAK